MFDGSIYAQTDELVWLSVSDASKKLGLPKSTIRRWIKKKDVRVQMGGPYNGYLVCIQDVAERKKQYIRNTPFLKDIDDQYKNMSADKKRFLSVLRDSCSVAHACRAIGVGRITVGLWRKRDEEFSNEWSSALDDSMDVLENSLYERALGKDTKAAIFLLKGHRPEKYREHSRVEMTGKDGEALRIETDARESLTRKLTLLSAKRGNGAVDKLVN